MGLRGPKPKFVFDRNRQQVVGLVERSDGRYVAHDDRNRTFGRDRDEAIRRYRLWEAQRNGSKILLSDPPRRIRDDERAALARIPRLPDDPEGEPTEMVVHRVVDEASYWERVRRDLMERPRIAAQRTGIAELGFLHELKPPPPSAKLADLLTRYIDDKSGRINKDEITNARTWWGEFERYTGARKIADLSHEAFRKYRARVQAAQKTSGYQNSYTRARFAKIKAIINHASAETDLSPQDRQTLLLVSLLKLPPKPKGKPVDIERDEFDAILKAATDPRDLAAVLLGLNCCFYPVDLQRLRWESVDLRAGTISFDREKSTAIVGSAIVRVAVLWERTIKALRAIQTDSKIVFPDFQGQHTITRRFSKIIKRADLKRHISFSHLRDSGQTRAAAARVMPQQYQCLAGHRFAGCDDNYIRRNPMFVKDACAAIETFYFG